MCGRCGHSNLVTTCPVSTPSKESSSTCHGTPSKGSGPLSSCSVRVPISTRGNGSTVGLMCGVVLVRFFKFAVLLVRRQAVQAAEKAFF